MKFNRIVIDTSVIVASVKPNEEKHLDCLNLLKRIHSDIDVEVYEPPEFLLELHSILSRQRAEIDNSPLNFLTKENPLRIKDVVFITEADTTNFIKELSHRYTNDSVKTKRAADLVYLWLSWRIAGCLITVDQGLLEYSDSFNVKKPKVF